MSAMLGIGGINVEVVKKDVKNVHLTVHPPEGRVRIAAPKRMQLDVVRLYAISKLPWIRRHQKAMRAQARETAREYIDRESHYVWGQRYLLRVVEREAPAAVEVRQNELLLHVRPGTGEGRRRELLALWYRDQVRTAVGPFVAKWTSALKVRVKRVFVQRMKTKWGSCNPRSGNIRLNTELAKKPRECLEYIVVHEMVHLLAHHHDERFTSLMDRCLPSWRHDRGQLNAAPLAHETWEY